MNGKEKISPGLAKLFLQAKQERDRLWASHEALLRIINNALDEMPQKFREEFAKYPKYRNEVLEKYLLSVGDKNPKIAQDLGAGNLPSETDEEDDGK